MLHPLTQLPSKILRSSNTAVTSLDDALRALVADMYETMDDAKGVGLAAPQIGKNLMLFVADDGKERIAVANPVITFSSKDQRWLEEGCLSIPGQKVDVRRPAKVHVRGIDALTGKSVFIKGKGLMARILQHEIDHLNQTLIIDHAE